MNDSEFIENQVKFMYGKYYEDIINGKEFIINDENITGSVHNMLNNVFDNPRINNFIQLLRRYWHKDSKNYVIKSDWNDTRVYNEFILTHNRLYNNKDQVIFPLTGYHLPSDHNMKIEDHINFKQKNNKLFWRGSTTGVDEIHNNKRYNIVSKNINIHENINIGFNNFCQGVYNNNVDLFLPLYKETIDPCGQVEYKFILNIEGNDYASAFPWALSSNCCPLHNYPFTYETIIFGQGLKPYVHFVPINNDGSDLLEKYEWCLDNLEKCEEIANNGKIYMEKYLRQDLFDSVMIKFFELYPLHS
jgi:hypothetical protein